TVKQYWPKAGIDSILPCCSTSFLDSIVAYKIKKSKQKMPLRKKTGITPGMGLKSLVFKAGN
ncbi:MAG: hypothetical protein KAX20_01925, partial [Candidatus Omnitrophica bacterium]|nr:hypothetical protein [Candidatus Omnitrophota bacterium]